MFKVIIPHPEQGQSAIKFETGDRNIARMAALVAKAAGVKAKVTLT